MEPERLEILMYISGTGLDQRCIQYNTNKCRDKELVKDLHQELWLWLCTYDLEKLQNAYENKHLNALITRYVQNQYFSNSSPFYKYFKKFQELTDDITDKELNIPDL